MFGPRYFYLSEDLKDVPVKEWKEAKTAVDTESYKDGDIVESWDHVFRWKEGFCVPRSGWETWRVQGDLLADAALPEILASERSKGSTDLMAKLRETVTDPDCHESVRLLWEDINRRQSADFVWPDEAQILRGQAVFYRYAPQIALSLLHFSLSAGFSNPRISRVLNLASYLVPPMESTPRGEAPRISKESNDRSFQRIMETTQWLVNCMGPGAMEPGEIGWLSTIRIRLLHTLMRQRLLTKSRNEWKTKGFSHFDESNDGIPLSQEDFVVTLGAFSAVPLISLWKYGIVPSQQECDDYTALWRVIGFYFGVDPLIIHKHFGDWEQNKMLHLSAIPAMFAGESDPPPPCHFPFDLGHITNSARITRAPAVQLASDPYLAPATLPVLFCMVDRWPMPFTFAQHCAGARFLMGSTLANWLSVPRSSWSDNLSFHLGCAWARLPSHFARRYRAGWDAKRRAVIRESVEFVVRQELGNRQSKFRPREPDSFTPVKEGDEFGGVDLGQWSPRGIFGHWVFLYVEAAVVLLFAVFFWPLTVPYLLLSRGPRYLP